MHDTKGYGPLDRSNALKNFFVKKNLALVVGIGWPTTTY